MAKETDMADEKLPSKLDNASISKPSISKLQKQLDDRIDQTEAIKLATMIVTSYPNTDGKVSESYLGAIASILQDYPASVARRCATKGIVLVCKFLPTVADIVAYCEGFTEPLRRQTDILLRRQAQFKERDEFIKRETQERPKRLSIKQLKGKYGDWSNDHKLPPKPGSFDDMLAKHGRPIGPFETPGDRWNRGIAPLRDDKTENPVTTDDNDPFYGL